MASSVNKIDLSLDEIIKLNKKETKSGRGAQRGTGRGRGTRGIRRTRIFRRGGAISVRARGRGGRGLRRARGGRISRGFSRGRYVTPRGNRARGASSTRATIRRGVTRTQRGRFVNRFRAANTTRTNAVRLAQLAVKRARRTLAQRIAQQRTLQARRTSRQQVFNTRRQGLGLQMDTIPPPRRLPRGTGGTVRRGQRGGFRLRGSGGFSGGRGFLNAGASWRPRINRPAPVQYEEVILIPASATRSPRRGGFSPRGRLRGRGFARRQQVLTVSFGNSRRGGAGFGGAVISSRRRRMQQIQQETMQARSFIQSLNQRSRGRRGRRRGAAGGDRMVFF